VSRFGDPAWWYIFEDNGYFETSQGGIIEVNFTGFAERHPFDSPDVFPENCSYLNLKIYNFSIIRELNFTKNNISNKEASWALTLGYNGFQSGFLIPIMKNISNLRDLAFQEEDPGGAWDKKGSVYFLESNLTIKIVFLAADGSQNTYLIYEKITGLLLWADVSAGGYQLEMTIEGYIPGTYEEIVLDDPPDEEEEEKEEGPLVDPIEPWVPLISTICIVGAITGGGSLLLSKKTEISSKLLVVGIIAIASFTGFFLFSYGMIPGLEVASEAPEEEPADQVEDITLIIDYGDGNVDEWEDIKLDEGETTVFDLLNEYSNVEYEDYGDMGYFVESINGYENGEKNWYYGVNGEGIGYSCSKYNLEDGDVVNWVYGQQYEAPA
ncbi:MAG: DUF4430 domain-containing protein, partial [Promethearchaeota archaeon]